MFEELGLGHRGGDTILCRIVALYRYGQDCSHQAEGDGGGHRQSRDPTPSGPTSTPLGQHLGLHLRPPVARRPHYRERFELGGELVNPFEFVPTRRTVLQMLAGRVTAWVRRRLAQIL